MIRPRQPFALDEKRNDGEVRYYYGDSEITANIDVADELAALIAHYESKKRGGSGGGASLTERKRVLRRKIGMEGMTLEEARLFDYDAYADESKSKLKELLADFHRLPENQAKVGHDFYKATVVILAASGNGKGIFADDFLDEMQLLAWYGGRTWRRADPAGRNAVEGVRRSELVLHDDARFWILPTTDEMYRYLDANRMSESDTRYAPTPAYAPRVVALTTSNTLHEFALTLVTRKPSDVLADQAEGGSSSRPRNVDELLRRLGWCVEVRSPDWVTEQEGHISKVEYAALIRREMVVSFSRIRKARTKREVTVKDREGAILGVVSTDRDLEQVALIKGSQRASRFLASSIIEEYSPDVAFEIPDHVKQDYAMDRNYDEQQSGRAREQQMLDKLSASRELNRPEIIAHFQEAHLAGLETRDPAEFISVNGTDYWCNTDHAYIKLADASDTETSDEMAARLRREVEEKRVSDEKRRIADEEKRIADEVALDRMTDDSMRALRDPALHEQSAGAPVFQG